MAFESYRVTDALIAEFRARYPDDRTLIEFTSWVSLTAARVTYNRVRTTEWYQYEH